MPPAASCVEEAAAHAHTSVYTCTHTHIRVRVQVIRYRGVAGSRVYAYLRERRRSPICVHAVVVLAAVEAAVVVSRVSRSSSLFSIFAARQKIGELLLLRRRSAPYSAKQPHQCALWARRRTLSRFPCCPGI